MAALSLLRSPARTSLCGRSPARGGAARKPGSPCPGWAHPRRTGPRINGHPWPVRG